MVIVLACRRARVFITAQPQTTSPKTLFEQFRSFDHAVATAAKMFALADPVFLCPGWYAAEMATRERARAPHDSAFRRLQALASRGGTLLTMSPMGTA
jgi:hypothetical protein